MKKFLAGVGNLVKRIQYNSPVMLTYALLSFIVLIIGTVTGGASNRLLFSVYKSSWADPLGYIRLFGHALGHANWAHYAGNFLLILMVGPLLEEKYRSKIMLLVIAGIALVEGLFFAIFLNVGVMGASGVVFGLILLSSFVNYEKGRIPLTLVLAIAIYVGKEFFLEASEAVTNTTSGISHIAHIIGGIFGAILGLLLERWRDRRSIKI
ncbi:MAG: rhomboid family intramembrane serine protease [Propionibacteriaceae bacterium]|jgi:membrane associated rhomboid family serine protease|nr:rhomboid family intramembrane serine protease [Propionibacteriaceae bacterium]